MSGVSRASHICFGARDSVICLSLFGQIFGTTSHRSSELNT